MLPIICCLFACMKHIDIVKLLMAGDICMNKYFASCAPIRESPSRSIDLSRSHSPFLKPVRSWVPQHGVPVVGIAARNF